MIHDIKSCRRCSNCILEDYGYSNYTTEGSYLHCRHHPESGFDAFYGEEPKTLYAEKCEHYQCGELDCDRENEFTDLEKERIHMTLPWYDGFFRSPSKDEREDSS